MPGMLVPSERDRVHMFALRKPIGVVGLITPWNFPSAIPAWKLAPALICGNTVVVKPASAAPLSAWRIVEALHEAGIPKGVVNFVAGSGGELGEALVERRAAQGRLLHRLLRNRRLAARRGRPSAACASSSKWAARIRPSCWPTPISTPPWRTSSTPRSSPPARNAPPPAAPSWKTPSTTSSSPPWWSARSKLKVGDGMQAGIDIGPCVDQAQMETVLRYIEIGRKECGRAAVRRHAAHRGRARQGLLRRADGLRRRHRSAHHRAEEIFGPVLAIMRATDFEDAMRIANNIPFGLSVFHPDHQSLARLRIHLPRGSRTAHRQPAQRGRGVPASLRRHQGFQLRAEGTGSGGDRILQRLQDRLPEVLI